MNSLPEEPDDRGWSVGLPDVRSLSVRSDLDRPLRTEPKRLAQEAARRGLQDLRQVRRSHIRPHRGRL